MKTLWICLLLVLSIASQSFAAVVNLEPPHQVDVSHLQTTHDHASDTEHSSSATQADEHNSNDCHHCGHCQGTHLQWFSEKSTGANSPVLIAAANFVYHSGLDKRSPDELIRPPIA